jgi:spore germination protein
VRSGDTVYSISRQFGISLNQLLRNNPVLKGGSNLAVGQPLNIVLPQPVYDREVDVNGYVYPNVSRETLMRTLPYLTYITVFTYGIREDGTLIDVDDEEIIELARQYGVAPIMQISSITERGTFSTEAAARLFSDEALQNQVIEELLSVLEEKRYTGVDVDFEYVEGQYADAYVAFVEKLHSRLNPLGYEVFVAVAPKYNADQPGLLYEGHDYPGLGAAADGILLMSYEWGYSRGEPQAVSPLYKVRRVVDYGVSVIPPNKIFLGMPNYGYDWRLPFIAGETIARSLSNVDAVALAKENKAEILFDEVAQSPFYHYFVREDGRPIEHVVWFEDARSVAAMLGLVEEYSLRGFAVWNLMRYFPQLWLVLNNTFRIRRGLS